MNGFDRRARRGLRRAAPPATVLSLALSLACGSVLAAPPPPGSTGIPAALVAAVPVTAASRYT